VARAVAVADGVWGNLSSSLISARAGTVPWSSWTVVLCLTILLPRGPRRYAVLPVVVLFAAYLAIFVVTPHELAWHIRTALPRLMLQVLPLLLLVAVDRLSAREDPVQPPPTKVTISTESPSRSA
jgi:hypothetical protein